MLSLADFSGVPMLFKNPVADEAVAVPI